jgi:hypothetical protein
VGGCGSGSGRAPAGILYLATTLAAYRSTDRCATWRPSAVSASRSTVRPSDSLVDVTVVGYLKAQSLSFPTDAPNAEELSPEAVLG